MGRVENDMAGLRITKELAQDRQRWGKVTSVIPNQKREAVEKIRPLRFKIDE